MLEDIPGLVPRLFAIVGKLNLDKAEKAALEISNEDMAKAVSKADTADRNAATAAADAAKAKTAADKALADMAADKATAAAQLIQRFPGIGLMGVTDSTGIVVCTLSPAMYLTGIPTPVPFVNENRAITVHAIKTHVTPADLTSKVTKVTFYFTEIVPQPSVRSVGDILVSVVNLVSKILGGTVVGKTDPITKPAVGVGFMISIAGNLTPPI